MYQFNIETRCRSCGGANTYWGGQASLEDTETLRAIWLQFYKTVEDWTKVPRVKYCENCRENAVQGILLYTPFPGTE